MLTLDPPVRPILRSSTNATAKAPLARGRGTSKEAPKQDELREPARSQKAPRACTWQGASGRVYLHRVYDFIWCPEIPNANVVFVHRACLGPRTVLHAGVVENGAPSLNLAQIRQLGAQLGANEIHVYDGEDDPAERIAIADDVHRGQADDDNV